MASIDPKSCSGNTGSCASGDFRAALNMVVPSHALGCLAFSLWWWDSDRPVKEKDALVVCLSLPARSGSSRPLRLQQQTSRWHSLRRWAGEVCLRAWKTCFWLQREAIGPPSDQKVKMGAMTPFLLGDPRFFGGSEADSRHQQGDTTMGNYLLRWRECFFFFFFSGDPLALV